MIRTLFNNLPNKNNIVANHLLKRVIEINAKQNLIHKCSTLGSSSLNMNCKIRYFFARKVSQLNKGVEQNELEQKKVCQPIQLSQQKKKGVYYKATQNYTFIDLDKDLQMYQQYLNIFNSHTKKAHDKLIKNQIKIIQCIISQNRQDLLIRFLSTNYRNRLANVLTIDIISNYYIRRIKQKGKQILLSSVQCQSLLESISLLTQYNQLHVFKEFISTINKIYQLNNNANQQQHYLTKILNKLPNKQCQFLTIYNYLVLYKQLPQYLMTSSYFGINTQNLQFNHLGQTFYQIRKFVRRYFSLYSKQNQNHQQLKTFQRQNLKTNQSSRLENDVLCFLKALNYQNIRKQIEIDGFIVDFVIDNPKPKTNNSLSRQEQNSTILQVMGSYHYTSKGKLKTKDLRKLILLGSKYRQRKYNIKLIHYDDLNKSKGFRNKMQLIKNILDKKDQSINWQPQNKGFDSNWQLKEHYEQFK